MMWTDDTLRQWARETRQGEVYGPWAQTPIGGFSIDTRTLQPGEIFIALPGTRSDGHRFIEEAVKKGAAGVMVSRSEFSASALQGGSHRGVIVVSNPLEGLQSLARWHRQKFSIPVIGITGSNGKTTTKEMLARIFKNPVLKTHGNFNNTLGLPLTLLRLTAEDRAAILEMGISQPGEMKVLCDIALPTVGLITQIGSAHLEFLGDRDGVAREKRVLFDLLPGEGIAIINRDDPYLVSWTGTAREQWSYALHAEADVTALDIEHHTGGITFTLQFKRHGEGGGRQKITLSLLGLHQVYNAMAAATVALALGYAFDDIREGLRRVEPISLRCEVIHFGGATLLLDSYNANPDSVCAALHTLAAYRPSGAEDSVPSSSLLERRKVAILGDMLELGAYSAEGHRKVGQSVAENKIDRLIVVGQWGASVAQGAQEGGMKADAIRTCARLNEIDLTREIQGGDVVLIKGSRRMAMETILPFSRPKDAHAV